MSRPRASAKCLVACIAVLFVVVPARHASAHTRAADSTNVHSRIVSDPSIPGVRWSLDAGGRSIEMTVAGDTEVVILGYEGEPFLRVGPQGVFKNLNSPAAYMSARREADAVVPSWADPSGPVEWILVSRHSRHVWFDGRVRFDGAPPRAASPVLLGEWSVPVVHEDRELALRGEMWWTPAPPLWQPLGLALVLLAMIAVAVTRGRRALLMRAAGVCVAAVAVVNALHVVDEVAARPVAAIDAATGVAHTLLFIGAGVGGAWWSLRTRAGSPWVLAAGSIAVLGHQGLLQVPMLWSSSIPTVWPPGLIRVVVGASVLQVLAVGLAIGWSRAVPSEGPKRDGAHDSVVPVACDVSVRDRA